MHADSRRRRYTPAIDGEGKGVIRRLEVDDAADVVKTFPRRKQVSILKRVGAQKAKEISILLAYDEETAGGIMTTLFLTLPGRMSGQQAIEQLRTKLHREEINPDIDLSYIYILDDAEKLVGVSSLREILTAKPAELLSEIMTSPVIGVHPEDDQEHVARFIADYNFSSVPVVTEQHKIIGIG